jgi:hypothetical protein
VLAFAASNGRPFFTRTDPAHAMGLLANPATAVLAIVVGAVVLVGVVVGRTVDHWATLLGGFVLVLAGLISLLLARTDANVLAFGIPNCIAALAVGIALMNCGAYVAVASDEAARHREAERYYGAAPVVQRVPRQRVIEAAPVLAQPAMEQPVVDEEPTLDEEPAASETTDAP